MNDIVNEYSVRNSKNIEGDGLYERERGELFRKIIGMGKTVVDLGARHGSLTKWFIKGNQVTGVDFDPQNLDHLKNKYKCETILFDLNDDISKLDRTWEVVVTSEVLEHLYFPEKKVEQITRIMAADGVFLGSVPNGFSLKNRLRLLFGRVEGTTLSEPTHITHFSYRTLQELLGRYFEEVKIFPIQQPKYLPLVRLAPGFFAFILAFECRGLKNGSNKA